jgi:hypothetical protein
MERIGPNIISTPAEQTEFNVPEIMTVIAALDTADAFLEVGSEIAERAGMPFDKKNRSEEFERLQRAERALRLISYANGVTKLCPVEYTERLLS